VTIDGAVILGDFSRLANPYNLTQGINFDDYMTRNLVIRNCDIEGMTVGISAPMMVGRVEAMDTTLIENCYLANMQNIVLTPPRSVNGNDGLSAQTLLINDVRFGVPGTVPSDWCSNIALGWVDWDSLGVSDASVPQYVYVTNYNGVPGDDFQVFYADDSSPTGKPSNADTKPGIDGVIQAMP
jgi:hypothetical protein